MKMNLKRTLIGILVVLALGLGALSLIGKDNRDRLNPFIEEKDVYALIDQEGERDPNFEHRYMFMVDGVDDSGKVQEIKITSSVKDLPEETYVKVHVKGTYVYDYEAISKENVPENAIKELRENK